MPMALFVIAATLLAADDGVAVPSGPDVKEEEVCCCCVPGRVGGLAADVVVVDGAADADAATEPVPVSDVLPDAAASSPVPL